MRIRLAAVSLALLAGATAVPLAAQSADPGETVFNMRCKACHVLTPGGAPGPLAPNLRGVVGRKAASTAYKAYSPALKASKLTWNAATLDKYIAAPAKTVPGTRMVMAVADANQRKALIAWLTRQR
ncbi:cytochrome c family protein [Novosphingobium sp. TH158]|uniref:c-type cytochrome n=1 Tax=Novosphingobium sp. TH158 TaxID=2067455 RepID=UPI000C7D8D7A|nr:c-type cytochrome [Novosphingobium sp. TH158]PLK26302.1 cytochrome c family protein [Novosphingobium sp. TH158]